MNRSGSDYSGTVQQLMFNRILRSVRLLAVEGVTVTHFDPNRGTLEGKLAGVTFVVNVSTMPPVVVPESR
jgi:hypothetical protein